MVQAENATWWSKYDFLLVHLGCLFLLILLFSISGDLDLFPLNEKLLQWDTGWYDNIRQFGYQYSDIEQSNSGFYPLFPYVWKWTGLSVFGITLVNMTCSLTGLYLLYRNLSFGKMEMLVALSLPSMFFLFVPYTESFFFLFGSIFLVGLHNGNKNWIWAGIFLASLTRPTAVFYVPALVCVVLLSSKTSELRLDKIMKDALFYLSPIVSGLLVVVLWQWLETGVWFAYFKAQSAHWYRGISIPNFPLSTWNYTKILWLDALAFLVGSLAFGMILKKLIAWLKGNLVVENKAIVFSTAYIAVVFLSLILFNPKNQTSGLTEISGANRYVFVSPFFFVLILNYLRSEGLPLIVLLATPLIWFLFNVYDEMYLLPFAQLTIYAVSFLLLPRLNRLRSPVTIVLYLVGMVLQLYVFSMFIRGEWVG